jgi:capsular polysaccharide transport system permease protein
MSRSLVYVRGRWGGLFIMFEPLALIALTTLAHSPLDLVPPFGTSRPLFYCTGILPYYMFLRISSRTRMAEGQMRVPQSNEFDWVLAHTIEEFFAKLLIIAICLFGMWCYGIPQALPMNWSLCILALLILAMVGVAVGLINTVISFAFPGWLYGYALIGRSLTLFSGVFMVIDWVPDALRKYLLYNPVAHAIMLFRQGVYGNYPMFTFDAMYVTETTVGLLLFSMALRVLFNDWRTA